MRLWDSATESQLYSWGAPVPFTLVLRRAGALRRLLLPLSELSLIEGFVDGDIDIEGDLESATMIGDLVARRVGTLQAQLPASCGGRGEISPKTTSSLTSPTRNPNGRELEVHGRRRFGRRHSPARDAQVVQFHYDLSNEFYALWLDRRMVYSCGYFDDGVNDLEGAQEAKLDYVCRKLRLEQGERLLDIGCGWGALILHAVQRYGVTAVGITLSERQAAWARARIAEAGLSSRCRVEIADYRTFSDASAFDKIASIGMVEHVGIAHLGAYFAAAQRLLASRGLFLNPGIVSLEAARPPGLADRMKSALWRRGAFFDHYVFPDGDLVASASIIAGAEGAGFELRDVESLREHYIRTLRWWVQRLEAHESEAVRLVGAATYRVWRLYLASAAYGFRVGRIGVIQSLLAKPDAAGRVWLPPTRRDLYALRPALDVRRRAG